MIVKSFIADTVAGALKKARTELGGDAVILKTRRLDGIHPAAAGGKVEVTACIDRAPSGSGPLAAVAEPPVRPQVKPAEVNRLNLATAAPAPVKPTVPDSPAAPVSLPSGEPDTDRFPAAEIVQKIDFLIDVVQAPLRRSAFPGNIGRLFACLLQADLPEAVAYDVAEKIADRFQPGDSYQKIARSAVDMVCRRLPDSVSVRPFEAGQTVVVVGPAGSGKTSLIGRLAGYLLRQQRLPVVLTSLDQVKVAATEELTTYADILDVDHFAMPRRADRSLIDRQGKDKVVLLDTPALNPRDREEIAAVGEKLAALAPDRIIGVFAATVRSSDLLDSLRAYRAMGMTELAATMTDQTCRLGGILALSIHSGLPVTILGTGRGPSALQFNPNYRRLVQECLGAGEGADDE